MNNIILVGGSKGGVGKSIVSIGIAENYITNGIPLSIVETDTSNADVYKVYGNLESEEQSNYPIQAISLDTKEGWLALVDYIENTPLENDILINTAARNNTAITENGDILNNFLPDLKRKLITFWPINRHKDSVELLIDYLEAMTNTKIYVLYNLFYGADQSKFEAYNTSKISKEVIKRGGAFEFPDLAHRVADIMANDRTPPHKLLSSMPIGTRIEYTRWLSAVKEILDKTIFQDSKDKNPVAE
jgi:hypothetical protein